jgi:putative ABC transport system permease protein
MLKNFLIISFRNLIRQKGFSLINLLGLTMGLTVSFLILLYVFNELSYDKFHKDSHRIYRIAISGNLGEMPLNVAVTPGALAMNLAREMPEVEEYTLFEHLSGDQLFRSGDNKFYENHLVYADERFFRIFNFTFLYGDPETALTDPYTLVLKRSISERFFGTANSIGEIIKLNNDKDYIVTGIIEDPPDETHLAVNFIASFATRVSETKTNMYEDWGSMMYYSYLKLKEGVSKELFENKMADFLNKKLLEEDEETKIKIMPYLQPVTKIHLSSRLLGELKPNSDLSYIYVLSLIAAAILFIAGINFMNLSTARSASRAKEVSIRKIVGSTRKKLIYQFMGESIFLSTLGFVLSLVLIEILLPVFNNVTNKSIDFSYYFNFELIITFFIISFLIGLFSGSYPALYLSAFSPVKVLQSTLRSGGSNKSLRNVLVFIQFAISSGLIACTLIIFSQLKYLQEKKLGFEKNNMIAIYLRNEEIRQHAGSLKEEFSKLAVVESASLASSIPGMSLNGSSYFPEGISEEPWLLYEFDVDEDFIENTFRMEIIEGRNFSREFPSDSNAVIINKTLQKSLKWQEPLGKTFTSNNDKNNLNELHVIGVVADFHFRSLHEKIEPTMIHYSRNTPGFLTLRINSNNLDKAIKIVEQTWGKINPELPFDFEFIDESFNSLYSSERRLSYLLTYLSIFAIFIASLGLLGLTSYTAEQRTKEIGIRKVMGASIFSITRMLSVEYIRLILFANILAWPASYYLMRLWLQDFSYRINIPVWHFVVAAIGTLFIALFVINLHTMRSASQNPVKSLRYE